MRTFKTYPLHKTWKCNTVLPAITALLYIRCPELIQLVIGRLCPLTKISPSFSLTPTLVTSIPPSSPLIPTSVDSTYRSHGCLTTDSMHTATDVPFNLTFETYHLKLSIWRLPFHLYLLHWHVLKWFIMFCHCHYKVYRVCGSLGNFFHRIRNVWFLSFYLGPGGQGLWTLSRTSFFLP